MDSQRSWHAGTESFPAAPVVSSVDNTAHWCGALVTGSELTAVRSSDPKSGVRSDFRSFLSGPRRVPRWVWTALYFEAVSPPAPRTDRGSDSVFGELAGVKGWSGVS